MLSYVNNCPQCYVLMCVVVSQSLKSATTLSVKLLLSYVSVCCRTSFSATKVKFQRVSLYVSHYHQRYIQACVVVPQSLVSALSPSMFCLASVMATDVKLMRVLSYVSHCHQHQVPVRVVIRQSLLSALSSGVCCLTSLTAPAVKLPCVLSYVSNCHPR